jgi:hypothetical protein
VLLFPIIIVIAIIPILIYLIIVKDGCLGLVPRIGYLPILYIVPIIIKSGYLGSAA